MTGEVEIRQKKGFDEVRRRWKGEEARRRKEKRMESHWFTPMVDLGRFSSLSGKGTTEREREKRNEEKGRQYCDAGRKLGRNFDGRSDDDEAGPPYFHELEEDTIAKLRAKSFRTE